MVLALVAYQGVALTASSAAFRVDPAASRIAIHVGKAGAFSFIAGHSHEVAGPIQSGSLDVDLDDPSKSRIRLVVAASALAVSAAGEPEGDAPKVQAAMASDKVLDVAHYPQITYESSRVTVKSRRGQSLSLDVAGKLTIRDVTQPVEVPVQVELADEKLTARGRFEIKQTAFGIKPISVGGVVAVKDTLGLEFTVVATK